VTTKKLTKLLALYLSYILLGLVATNLGEVWRLAEGKELGDKIMAMMGTFPVAFANPLPSLHLRVQYREAGMSEDAIQAMYEFDLGVLNSERAYITNTMTVSGVADDGAAKETSDFNQYEKAVTVTDTYHETKSRFAWIGEIENEQLLTALETLKVEDLEIITMYAYEGYDITEISKVYGVSRPTISIKIKRITKFLKNFNFNATN
jgi:RNA polymerase sigma factor (sigma-70 family)